MGHHYAIYIIYLSSMLYVYYCCFIDEEMSLEEKPSFFLVGDEISLSPLLFNLLIGDISSVFDIGVIGEF